MVQASPNGSNQSASLSIQYKATKSKLETDTRILKYFFNLLFPKQLNPKWEIARLKLSNYTVVFIQHQSLSPATFQMGKAYNFFFNQNQPKYFPISFPGNLWTKTKHKTFIGKGEYFIKLWICKDNIQT